MYRLVWIGHDLRYAFRSLLRDRATTALAVLALSLGIGATTVIFSVVYSVLINAFPFADSTRVVHFYIQTPEYPGRSAWYPVHEFVEYRAQNDVFTELLGGASLEVLYELDNSTYRVRGALLDPKAPSALGIGPVLGRGMSEADGAQGAPPTFLISDRLWNERFNRDPTVIGRTLNLNGTPRTLIAVLPPRFLLHGADVFFPTTIVPGLTDALVGGDGSSPLMVWTYGRLKPGVTPAQAEAQLDVLARTQARLNPERYPDGFTITIMSLADAYTASNIKELVYILVGAVLMLLLIACSNVANLLLARATARESEMALRAGLGASRRRLVQLLLAESFILAGTGTIAGALLAFAGMKWVQSAIPIDALPAEVAIQFSGRALLWTVGVTLITTIACGLVPGLRAARGNLRTRLAGAGKGVGLRGRSVVRTFLVTVQVALAIVLLVGAGLMMRTFIALQQVELGLETDNVFIGRLAFSPGSPRSPDDMRRFIRDVTTGIGATPGVEAVSPSLTIPISPGPSSAVAVVGLPARDEARAFIEGVGDGYFRTVGLNLIRGRLLSVQDVDGARPVVVVNDRFAEEFLGGANPLGRMVTFAMLNGSDKPALFEIVGVVNNVRNNGLHEPPASQVFLPFTATPFVGTTLLVRTSTAPAAIERAVRERIWAVDRGVALTGVTTLAETVHRNAMASPRFGVGLMLTFAVVGLVLAAIGVFSVMAYTVSLQTHDIGIRMAHGAQPRDVVRTILWTGLRPVGAGVVIGLAASAWLSKVMTNQIYGVATTDPWTFAGVAIFLIVVAACACAIPARRAAKVNPLTALRQA